MTLTPKGPHAYDLGDLTPDHFEILTFLLAREEFPDTVHVRQNDFGLDARLPNAAGKTLLGWQSKRFTGAINWSECQDSVRRSLAFWRPLRITFTFPKVLSGTEQKNFRERLIEEFPSVRIDWWDDTELQTRMRDTEGGQRAAEWLFGNPEAAKEELQRVIAVGGELSDAADAAERAAEVQKFMGRDPHFQYSTVSTDAEAPTPPLTPGTIVSMETDFGEQRVRFDATERYPGAAADTEIGGKFVFTQDEAGRLAREAVMKVIDEGGSVRIESGIAAQFDAVPVGLRGMAPEEPVPSTVEISSTERSRPTTAGPGLPTLVRAGEAELGIVLAPADPPHDWDRAISGAAGGLEIFIAWRGPGGEPDRRMDWRWNLGDGTALEQLLAAEIMLAAFRGASIELVTPADGELVAAATMDPREDTEEELAEVEHTCAFLGYAAEAEAWLGVPLEPPAQPTEADAKVLSGLIGRIREPTREGQLTRLEFVLSRPISDVKEPFQLALMHSLHGELFGEMRYLGAEQIHLARGRFEGTSGEEQAGDTVAVVPDGEAKVQIRTFPPAEVPEGATKPPQQPSGRDASSAG